MYLSNLGIIMSTLRIFTISSGSHIFMPNVFYHIPGTRNWEILRLTSLIILAVSTADIWSENVKLESSAADINSSS